MTLRKKLLVEANLVDRDRWGGDFEREYIDTLRGENTWVSINRERDISDQMGLYIARRLVRRFDALRKCDAGIAVIDAHMDKLCMVLSEPQIQTMRLWLQGVRQIDIAKDQKITQAAVSWRIQQACLSVNQCHRRLEDSKWLEPLVLAVHIKKRINNMVSFQYKPTKKAG